MLSVFVPSKRFWAMAAVWVVAGFATPVLAGPYVQTNLVSNVAGLAKITDPELVNPWGFSHNTTSPFWISNQNTNTSTLYAVTNQINVTKTNINAPNGFVTIPTTASGPQGPTGQVANTNNNSFQVNGARANFIFADLNGNILAWNSGQNAVVEQSVPGAVFTGLSINQAQTQLFAVSASTGVAVFDSSYAPVSLGATAFATPASVSALGLVTFNVQDLNGNVYVTYAPAGRPNQVAATGGQGAVAVFDENGVLLHTYLSNEFAAPWGVALAPSTFGVFGGDLLVGNFSFGESEINAFDPVSGNFLGTIPIDTGNQGPGGLWQIGFGTGGSNGDPNTLYFTDGINGETGGLFAAIRVPEPFTLSLFGTGLAGAVALRRRRAKEKAS